MPEPFSSSPQDSRPRIARLLLLRTLVVTVVLGLSLWLVAKSEARSRGSEWLQSTIIAATYVSSIVFGVMLRRGASPARVVRPMLANDLVLTSALVYVTGGALSPYTFLFALTIVTAGALAYRRGAVATSAVTLGAMTAVSLLAWLHAVDLPLPPNVQPWTQSGVELARTLGINIATMIGVGALSIIFGDQLATTRREAADLLSLNQDIVRSLSSGLITLTPEGTVLTANEAAAEILRTTELTGRRIQELLPGLPDDVTELRRADVIVRDDLVVGATVSPLRDRRDQVIGRVINFQDLTELKRLELHARRAERLATVGQLAAGIAHEIRNPLASISGSVELLRQSPQSSDDDRALMTIVHREIQRLNVLIGDLLDYANPRPKQVVDFDAAVLVDEIVQVARADSHFADVELAIELARPIPLQADPAKLRQVLWNLLRNAAESGGKHIQVTAKPVGGGARIVVEDDGPGIAKDVLAHIFDPFYTTKPKGSGLGLATSHSVIAEHGGRIDVETEIGKGTKMVVSLPRPG